MNLTEPARADSIPVVAYHETPGNPTFPANPRTNPRTKSRRATCKSHCAACGRHFNGDTAFDLHRAGDHRAGARYCLTPTVDEERLELLADDGYCSISGEHDDGVPRVLYPVKIWTRRKSAEERARIAALSRRSSA